MPCGIFDSTGDHFFFGFFLKPVQGYFCHGLHNRLGRRFLPGLALTGSSKLTSVFQSNRPTMEYQYNLASVVLPFAADSANPVIRIRT